MNVVFYFITVYVFLLQMCEGDNDKSCQFAVHRRVHNNRCLNHPNAKLIESGPCSGHFVYIRPLADDDKRRWLGFVSAEGTKSIHTHPCPVRSKLGSKLQQGIEEAVKIDPSKTAREISKGNISFNLERASNPYNPFFDHFYFV